jgi:hypothetical protein
VSDTPVRLDLTQSRRRAKELLAAAKAGDPDALARLPRTRHTPQLADAQFAIATELGFSSWPQLVHALETDPVPRFTPLPADRADWSRVERITLVPFLADQSVVLLDDAGRLRVPAGPVRPGEHPIVDAPLRVALDEAGFRRQGTHPFATAASGRDLAMWIEGARYSGSRAHDADARWWTGSAGGAQAAARAQGSPNLAMLIGMAERARLALTDEQYWIDSGRVLEPSYLAAGTPEGGSGFGGSAEDWHDARSVLCDAIDRDGAFLDAACANGHLMDSMVRWNAARGIHLEPYGVDISEPLTVLAQQRLPQWADRIWVGNALTWTPPDGRRFDYVHTLLDIVPDRRHRDLVEHLLRVCVAPGGRLILSNYGPEPERGAATVLARLGYEVAGETRAARRRDRAPGPPSAWIDAPADRH